MDSALRELSKLSDDSRYRDTAEEILLPAWRGITGDDKPAAPDASRISAFVRLVIKALYRHAGGLRYDDRDNAVRVQDLLAARTVELPPEPLPANTGAATVVDAAWRWRQHDWHRFVKERGRVNSLALLYCHAGSLV
jgi:hypothetical protein